MPFALIVCLCCLSVNQPRPLIACLGDTPGRAAAQLASIAMADDIQILVRFITKLPAELRVPQTEVVRPPDLVRPRRQQAWLESP